MGQHDTSGACNYCFTGFGRHHEPGCPMEFDPPEAAGYFQTAKEAFAYLEERGYSATKRGNWLMPVTLREPSNKDRIAALYLGHTDNYGVIIVPARCPFCGGRADPHSTIGVECEDCGGNAPDIETWQRRAP